MQAQILASGAKIHTVARSNSIILESLKQDAKEWRDEFHTAQVADQQSYKEFMQSTAMTLNNVQGLRLDMSEKFTNVLGKHDEILRSLRRVRNFFAP
jgi:hypothetical protein